MVMVETHSQQPDAALDERTPPRAGLRMAYLLSRYPAISHTFLLHEVLGLRALGVAIETLSINPPDRAIAQLPAAEAAEARRTEYIQGGSRAAALGRVLTTALAHPAEAWRGLLAVLRAPRLTLRQRGFWLFYLAEALLAGRHLRARGLQHLHVHFGGAVATVGMLTAAAWRIPWSLTVHGPEELLNVDAYHLREKVDSAAFVFCISDFCRSQLCQLLPPAQWHKLSVLRLGVDPAALVPSPRATRQMEETVRLVCTGRLVAAKGHRILLEALSLLEARGVRSHVTLIGDGPERSDLEQYAREHGLDVEFTGALAHAQTLDRVRGADIFVLASFAEGIPVALMEAMALGLPVVSTTIAGIPELIEHGMSGWLVPPANAPALASALERLVRDAGLARILGTAARQRIVAEYNLPVNQRRMAASFAARLQAEEAEAR